MAKLKIGNPRIPTLQPLEVEGLADTGAVFLCLPEEVARQLQLNETSKKEVTLADGKKQKCRCIFGSKIGNVTWELLFWATRCCSG